MINGIESESLVKINVYYTSMNEKTIEDKIVYSIEVNWFRSQGFCFFISFIRTGAFSVPWEVASPSGLASPSATSLRSLSSFSTSLETSSTELQRKLWEGKQILVKNASLYVQWIFCVENIFECFCFHRYFAWNFSITLWYYECFTKRNLWFFLADFYPNTIENRKPLWSIYFNFPFQLLLVNIYIRMYCT